MTFPKNQKVIEAVKSATVAIGLQDLETGLVGISGSGFIFDPRGYVMTAAHVLNDCIKIEKTLQQKGKKIETVAVYTITSDTFNKVMPVILHGRALPSRDPGLPEFPTPEKNDIALAQMKKSDGQYFPFLRIKKPGKIKISDEIAVCGFPRGGHSLSTITTNLTGIRLSPPVQFGHVASLLPFDNAEFPYAIQTDIMGTSGSSGSPIFDPNTGEVVGIAQNVIPSITEVKIPEDLQSKLNNHEKFVGSTTVGLIWGDLNTRFYSIPGLTKDGFEKIHLKKMKNTLTNFTRPIGPEIFPPGTKNEKKANDEKPKDMIDS